MTCQVQQSAGELMAAIQQAGLSLTKLEADLNLCRTCNQNPDCVFMKEFRIAFNNALARITREWNLQRPR